MGIERIVNSCAKVIIVSKLVIVTRHLWKKALLIHLPSLNKGDWIELNWVVVASRRGLEMNDFFIPGVRGEDSHMKETGMPVGNNLVPLSL